MADGELMRMVLGRVWWQCWWIRQALHFAYAMNELEINLSLQEVDMVVAPLDRTSSRETVVDFTAPYYLDHNTVLVKYPDVEDKKWRLFINPFRWQVNCPHPSILTSWRLRLFWIQVWLVLAFVIPFSGCILWTLSRYSPFYGKDKACTELGLIDNALFYTFGAFFTQGKFSAASSPFFRFHLHAPVNSSFWNIKGTKARFFMRAI